MRTAHKELVLNRQRNHLRLLAVIAIAASTITLTGCTAVVHQVSKSSGRNTSDSSTTATQQPTTLREKLQAGTGTFNRADPNFQLFDPCKEISAERYKQLGWEQDEISYLNLKEGHKMISCNLYGTEANRGSGVMSVSNDALPYSYIDELGLIITDLEVELPPGVYLHGPIIPMEGYCAAAVETNSGRLNVVYSGSLSTSTAKTTICQGAVDFLSQILDTEV